MGYHPLQKRVAAEAQARAWDGVVKQVDEATNAHVPKRQAQQIARDAVNDFDAFYAQRPVNDSLGENTLLAGSSDAKGVRMLPKALREDTRKRAEAEQAEAVRGDPTRRQEAALARQAYGSHRSCRQSGTARTTRAIAVEEQELLRRTCCLDEHHRRSATSTDVEGGEAEAAAAQEQVGSVGKRRGPAWSHLRSAKCPSTESRSARPPANTDAGGGGWSTESRHLQTASIRW